jgi:MarR-like DNA-binding transcriptional regulator SgrR of sgrS sRNA
VAVEDTSDAQQLLGKIAQQGDSAFKVDYGDYHAAKGALLCSIIEEGDYYTAWLSLFLRFPFKALNLSDDMFVTIQSRLEAIRSEPDVEKSLSQLNEFRTWLNEQQIMTELKQENFRLEVSERIKGSDVDGFGWCQLSELWINQG